jgi:uncharacterized protein YkwD
MARAAILNPGRCTLALLTLPLAWAASALADADPLFATINGIRAEGCGRTPGVESPLRHDARLDEAARSLADGRGLKESVKSAGYAATQAAVLEGSGTAAGIARALGRDGCKDIVDPRYRDVGIARHEGTAWIVLAAPLTPPAAGDARAVGARVLALVNEARSKKRRCGWTRFDAAPPLAASPALDRAAAAHARDMAAHSVMGHAGSDGSTPAERATRAGYRWRLVAENVAAGQPTPEEAIAEWLDSAGHCANLMDPAYTEMGVGYAADPKSAAGVYWSQLFAAPAP